MGSFHDLWTLEEMQADTGSLRLSDKRMPACGGSFVQDVSLDFLQ